MATRSPICTVVGHVDHGKSSILDRIRGSAIVKSEAGAITQAIGASIIPIATLHKVCGPLLKKINLTIPGLLFIDTPGHAAFTNLRKRGGNLADIAILVIDIREGLMPQTIESIEILKQYKTPFLIAANKVDLLHGWSKKSDTLVQNITDQDQRTVQEIETKLYEIVGKLGELGIQADRFDRVSDYTKQVTIVPTSAETGEGIPELLMVLAGLAQKFLEDCLSCDMEGQAKGIILEVKDDKGIGKALDVILYDGSLKVGDTIIIGGLNQPIVTKVRALFEPAPLAEMRDKKSKFVSVKEAIAATGVKIAAPDIDEVVAGMPIMTSSDIEKAKEEVQEQVEEVIMETDQAGVVIKADSLGSLEALLRLLREDEVKIKKASIGNITKKDIADAANNCDMDPFCAVVLGFNVDLSVDVPDSVKVITSPVIYEIIEEYKKWKAEEKKRIEAKALDNLVPPCKVELMKGYVFRQSSPAIVGAEIVAGTLKSNSPLMNQRGKHLTTVKSIQADKETVDKAEKGKQVAVSMPGVTVGRQINEGDILYSDIPEEDFKTFKAHKDLLTGEQKTILKEIAEIKRADHMVWGNLMDKALKKKEVKEITKNLAERFGFSGNLDYIFFMSPKNRVYIINTSLATIPLDKLRINSIGMYFGEYYEKQMRLSIEGSQLIAPHCTKNVLELSPDQADEWLRGVDLAIEYEDKGFVLMKFKEDILGCGKAVIEKILNFVPKNRRLRTSS